MILLTGSSSLRVYLGAAATSNQLPIVVTYIDSNSNTFNPLAYETQTNNTTPVVVVDPPASGISRQLKYLSILNTDTTTNDVYVEYHTPTSDRRVFKQAITTNQKIEYVDSEGFEVIPGAFINVTGDAVTGVPFITYGSTALLGNYRILEGISGISTIDSEANAGSFSVGLSGNMYHNITGHTGDLSQHITGLSISNLVSGNFLGWNGIYWTNTGLNTGFISGFNEGVQDVMANTLYGTSGIAIIYNDSVDQIFISGQRASTTDIGLASFNSSNFTVSSGNVSVSAIPTGVITNLPLAIKDTIGNSGFLEFRGGLTGYWNQSTRVLTLDNFSGGGAGASALDDLTDVDAAAPSSGNFLHYNGSQWIASNIRTGDVLNLTEHTQDVIAASLLSTSGLVFLYNDANGTITLSGQRASTTSTFTGIGLAGFNATYFSVASGIATITGGIQTGQIVNYGVTTGQVSSLVEAVQDTIASSLITTSGLAVIYDDANGSIILSGQRASTSSLGLSYFDSNNFTVVSGLVSISAVPTGIITNYGVTTGQITNLPEAIQDTIAASLTTTSGLAVIYDDAAGSIVLSGQRATTVNPGLAIFSATNFSVNSGLALITGGLLTGFIVNLPQAITGTVGSAVGIDDLSGVYLGTMTSGQYLFFNGTGWTGNSILTEAISAMKLPNGHEDRATSTLSFDEGTRTFSIAPVGSSFSFWTSGRKYTKTTAQTIAIPDTSELYYFYFNC
jgi:hypothetical protein